MNIDRNGIFFGQIDLPDSNNRAILIISTERLLVWLGSKPMPPTNMAHFLTAIEIAIEEGQSGTIQDTGISLINFQRMKQVLRNKIIHQLKNLPQSNICIIISITVQFQIYF